MVNDNAQDQYEFDSSWSKYQMMVLQQLADHTLVLQNLNNNANEHKQAGAVHIAEFTMWKTHVNESIATLQNSIDNMLQDNKDIGKRMTTLEHHHSTESQIDLRSQSNWQTTSAFIVTSTVIVNMLIQLFVTFIKN